jgi:hypothetical protein
MRKFEKYWKRCDPINLVYSDRGAWGEPTAGTLCKIFQVILFYIGITDKDELWDWGAGKAKIFHGLQFFCPVPNLKGFGIEQDENVFEALKAIVEKQPLPNVKWLRSKSETVQSWEGATIVYNYDGLPNDNVELYFKLIMLKVFRTKSVKVVISTKLRPTTVWKYIFQDEKDFEKLSKKWVVVRIPKQYFGSKNPIQVVRCCHCNNHHHFYHRIVCCSDGHHLVVMTVLLM